MSSIAIRSILRQQSPLLRRALYGSLVISTRSKIPLSLSNNLYNSNAVRFQSSSAKAATTPEETRSKLSNETEVKIYSYEDIKNLITNPDPSKVLVDVREPEEFKQYAIPTSVNIPYKSTPGALDLTPEEFEDIFKFEKPSKDKELIFYCVAGVRSSAAADLAQIFGYKHLGNYIGSLEDWIQHEKPEPVKEETTEAPKEEAPKEETAKEEATKETK